MKGVYGQLRLEKLDICKFGNVNMCKTSLCLSNLFSNPSARPKKVSQALSEKKIEIAKFNFKKIAEFRDFHALINLFVSLKVIQQHILKPEICFFGH